jgi:hypothetical protein
MADYQANVLRDPDMASGAAPDIAQFTTYVEQPTIRQELVGPAKDIFGTQQQAEQAMANLGLREIGDLSSFLNQNFAAQLPAIQTQLGQYGQVAGAPNLAGYGTAGAPGAGECTCWAGATRHRRVW